MTDTIDATIEKTPFERASTIVTDLTRANFEEGMDTAREMMKANDLKKVMELQNELFRDTFKRNMEAARDLNELTLSSFKEVSQPYAERMTEMFTKFKAAD